MEGVLARGGAGAGLLATKISREAAAAEGLLLAAKPPQRAHPASQQASPLLT